MNDDTADDPTPAPTCFKLGQFLCPGPLRAIMPASRHRGWFPHTAMIRYPRRWDIFCKIVDNFGDAGVSWRLARMLAVEHGLDVTLWIDSPATLARIAPGVIAGNRVSRVDGVTVRQWEDPWPPAPPADAVVEAFGCGLPDGYVEAMAKPLPPPAWFILEYLSAEAWVEPAHGLPSPHPGLSLPRRFWFPGFAAGTGGLLRERDLLGRRDGFLADAAAQRDLWAMLRLPPPEAGSVRISLFCYPNPALPALLDTWADGDQVVDCVVPSGVASGAIDAWAGGAPPQPGDGPRVRGRLRLHAIPFVDQDTYDRLLWACDLNFVRGEDSFVRAQWAAKPFAWHIYPQSDDAHLAKLAAFLDRYTEGLDPGTAAAARRFARAWNGGRDAPDIGTGWMEFLAVRRNLLEHGFEWARRLAALPELAAGLVEAAAERV